MAALEHIIDYLDQLLEISAWSDYGPNGLQVPASPGREVTTVVTGVSAHLELFEAAREEGAELVLAHHGLFWERAPRAIDGPMRRKLKLLLDEDIALAAYHLPLDGHLHHGNNALIAAGLGAHEVEGFGEHHGRTVGVMARFAGDGIARDELVARVTAVCREPLAFLDGPERVRSLAILSGAGADYIHDAIAAGADAFLTGEPAERVMAIARENAITFLAAGHHATETHGIRRLGELVSERFAIRHVFVDIPNPI